MSKKKQAFLENAKLLRDKFQIVPLLYGSLGLQQLIDESLNVDDIDILIPKVFLNERWDEFQETLAQNGARLIDLHEHTFEKNGICYSYAQIEDLYSFANIPLSEIALLQENGVSYFLLSLRQYLSVYSASSKDGYRINVRQKNDLAKINLIKKYIK